MMKVKLFLVLFLILLCSKVTAQNNYLEENIGNDSFPYQVTLRKAVANKDTLLIGNVLILRGLYYEKKKMRREAVREYNKAYQLDRVRFKNALDYANNVKAGMNADHATALSEIEAENDRRRGNAFAVVKTAAVVAEAANEANKQSNDNNYSNATTTSVTPHTSSRSTSSSGDYTTYDNSSASTANSNTSYRSSSSTHKRTQTNSSSPAYIACSKCNGKGRVQCSKCNGTGRVKCVGCGGRGYASLAYKDRDCIYCNRKGTVRCTKCSDGKIICYTCNGRGKVKN